jgi:hypothetical protein
MVKRFWAGLSYGNLTATVAVFAAAALVALLSFATSAPGAKAEAIVPVQGPWSATTSVGLPVRFEVKEGNVIDAHFGFNWGFCGSYESHLPNTDPIDAGGHWSFLDTRGQTIEGTFVAPDRVEGSVDAVERELPGCPHTHATFVAAPGEVPPPVPPQVYVVADAITGHQSRRPEFVSLAKGLAFYFEIVSWHGLGDPVARADARAVIRRGRREWNPRASIRLSSLIADGPGKLVYSRLHYTLHGAVPKGFARRGSRTFG